MPSQRTLKILTVIDGVLDGLIWSALFFWIFYMTTAVGILHKRVEVLEKNTEIVVTEPETQQAKESK